MPEELSMWERRALEYIRGPHNNLRVSRHHPFNFWTRAALERLERRGLIWANEDLNRWEDCTQGENDGGKGFTVSGRAPGR